MMAITSLKIEKDLCRCCHSDGAFKSLYAPHWHDNEEIVYSNKLWECFNVELIPVTEPGNHMCAICDSCIQRLQDAIEFKNQVLECERKFQEMYLSHTSRVYDVKIDIKEELPDPEENNGFEFADVRACHSTVNVSFDSRIPYEAPILPHPIEEVELEKDSGEGTIKAAKRKKRKSSPANVKKKKDDTESPPKKKRASRPRKPRIKEVETDPEKLKARLRRPATRLKEGIDYNTIGDEFQCCRCENIHETMRRMRCHIMYVHFRIPRYHCRVCYKMFRSSSSFISHKLKVHNVDNRYKCNNCEKVFTSKTQLKSHMNSYHQLGVKRKCDVCDYETFSDISLRRHKVTHGAEKIYRCEYCSKDFKRNNALRLHEKIHTGVKGKVCKECGQAFVQKASLNYHMTKYHPEVKF